jgi:peptidyl-prolyl cis-trans isomerase C
LIIKNLKIYSQINNYFLLILFVPIFLAGCSKEHEKKEYVARVNDKYLTQEELNNMIEAPGNKNFYKNEIIRNWINNELLYQKAIKEGITSDSLYNRLIDKSRKELAVTLLLDKIYAEEKAKIDDKQVEEFYESNKNDFKAFYDAYIVNIIIFNNEEKAIRFRSILLETDWNRATNAFKNDTSVVNIINSKLYYDYELQPASLSKIVEELNPNEVSIIFSNGQNDFSIVQLINKFPQDSILPLDYVRYDVEKRLIANEKDEFIRNYIKELYSKNDIEVKNQD